MGVLARLFSYVNRLCAIYSLEITDNDCHQWGITKPVTIYTIGANHGRCYY